MKVICKNNEYYPTSLKVGKIYKIEKENDSFYFIVDENHEECQYPKELFEIKQ